ncbi:MAG: hypothetical protein RDU83_06215 [bacterium]|nr:hypothetical protein [bacterium]
MQRRAFGYRQGEGRTPDPMPVPGPPPLSEAEATEAIRQALSGGPLTFRALRAALPRVEEAVLARLLGSMRVRGEVRLLEEGWSLPTRWGLARGVADPD